MLPDTLSTIVQSQTDKWSGIAAIAAVFSSLAALLTVYLLITHQVRERKTHRPYIAIQGAGIKKTSDDEIIIYVTYTNSGSVPAKEFGGRFLFIDSKGDRKKELEQDLSIVNDIPPDMPLTAQVPVAGLPMEAEPYYIYFELHYQNPITGESYSHPIYMKWLGVEAGKVKSTFVHATPLEKLSIDNYLNKSYQQPHAGSDD